jgi:nitronate monooxygenase/enoyl-[acyl-carrier protein] reductase II
VFVLRTALCDLLGITAPVIQAGMGPFGSGPELAAAVSNAGALGTLGGGGRPPEQLKDLIARVRALTDRPFAVNFVFQQPYEEGFSLAVEARAPVISFALGDPGELVRRAHDAGLTFMQQVHTVPQARQVAERGVDVIIAQGGEAGGFGGSIATLPLLPQVVDAVAPIPVVAAGGIADGRGLAAALTLGAQGANLGTRFLASREASISEAWKQLILGAASDDAIKADVWWEVFPLPAGAFDVVPRALRTTILDEWQRRPEEAKRQAERLRQEVLAAVQAGSMEQLVPFTGQSAGLVTEILSAGEIVHRLVAEAEDALKTAAAVMR